MGEPVARGPLLIVHSSDEWYGADRMVAELAAVAQQVTSGAVEVWLPEGAPPPDHSLSRVLDQQGVAVRHLPLPILRRKSLTPGGLVLLARQTLALRRVMSGARPCAVVAATTAVVPVLWALPRRTASLLYAQEIWRSAERVVLGILALPADLVLAISDPVVDALPRRLQRRATVITNAVPDQAPPPIAASPDGPVTFVVASRWNSWKGHEFLLQAWDAADCPGRLLILGGPPPAGIAVDVPAMVSSLSDPASVEIVGEVADISAWLDRADALILPSTDPEPFGLVVIEAFSRARPVIATNHGAPASVVSPEIGWLVEPGDVAGFARVLRGISKSEATERGIAARRAYLQRYSMSAWRDAVRSLLLRLAGDAEGDAAPDLGWAGSRPDGVGAAITD